MDRFLNSLIMISLVICYGCSVKSLGNPSFQFHMLKGKEFHHSNQFDKAIDEYQKAVKLNPNSEEEKGEAERFLPNDTCSNLKERAFFEVDNII